MKLILRRDQSDPDVIFKNYLGGLSPLGLPQIKIVYLKVSEKELRIAVRDEGLKKREALTTTLTTPPCYSVLRQEPKLVYDRYTLA